MLPTLIQLKTYELFSDNRIKLMIYNEPQNPRVSEDYSNLPFVRVNFAAVYQ